MNIRETIIKKNNQLTLSLINKEIKESNRLREEIKNLYEKYKKQAGVLIMLKKSIMP